MNRFVALFFTILTSFVLAIVLSGCDKKSPETKKSVSAKPAPKKQVESFPENFDRGDNMDFDLEMKAIANNATNYRDIAGKKSLVFYFSATCPHCKVAVGGFMNLAKHLKSKGWSAISVASGSNEMDDLNAFLKEQNLTLPLFQDHNKKFGQRYGTGFVPLLFVFKGGTQFLRIRDYHGDESNDMVMKQITKWLEL